MWYTGYSWWARIGTLLLTSSHSLCCTFYGLLQEHKSTVRWPPLLHHASYCFSHATCFWNTLEANSLCFPHAFISLCPSFSFSLPHPICNPSQQSVLLGTSYPWMWTLPAYQTGSSLRWSEIRRTRPPWCLARCERSGHSVPCECPHMCWLWGFQQKCFGCRWQQAGRPRQVSGFSGSREGRGAVPASRAVEREESGTDTALGGRTDWRSLGPRKGGLEASWMRWVPLQKRPQRVPSPLPHGETGWEVGSLRPRSLHWNLTVLAPWYWTVRNTSLSFIRHPVYSILPYQLEWTKTVFLYNGLYFSGRFGENKFLY